MAIMHTYSRAKRGRERGLEKKRKVMEMNALPENFNSVSKNESLRIGITFREIRCPAEHKEPKKSSVWL